MKYVRFVLVGVVLGCSSSSSKGGSGGGGGGGAAAGGGGAAAGGGGGGAAAGGGGGGAAAGGGGGGAAAGGGGAAAGACGTAAATGGVAGAGNTDGGTTPDLTAGAVPVTLEHIALPDAPQRLAVDPMRNILYVMLSSAGTGGIVAVDMTTGNVLGKLATSGSGGSAGPFDAIAVDVDQNVVFGARYPTITVFDGATRMSNTSIDLSSDTQPADMPIIYGLAVDNLAHRLYAILNSPSVRVAVIDTSTATPSLVTSIGSFWNLLGPTPGERQYKDMLAIDTQNHQLFVCGDGTGDNVVTADYTIDTTQSAVTASQQILDLFVGCAAGPGFAEIAMLYRIGLLEAAANVFLPSVHYFPSGHASASASSVASNGYSYVNVSATVDACGGQRNLIYGYDFCGGQLVAQQPTALLDQDPSGSYHLAVMRTVALTSGNGADVYAVQVFDAPADGGTPPPALVRVHLPQAVFAAPADAGACP